MKILLIHSDFIEWEPKTKAIKDAEEVEKKKNKVEEALVVFSSVEKQDEKNPKQVAENAVKEIISVFDQVKAKNIVIYPFVHLSSNPSSPSIALQVLNDVEKRLKEKNLSVKRAPFGWYKEFDLKCKGHPLAELSKEISAEKREEPVEKEPKSEWFIVEPDGKMSKIEIKNGKIWGYDFSKYKNLEKFALYEMAKSRIVKEEPPHIKLMRRLQLVDYEEGSDPGNLRFLPNGRLVKSLLEEWVTRNVIEYGGMEVETPIMYDYSHPSMKSYVERFPARQYTIETPNKRVFLRFAACFGQFLLAHDTNISYKDLPLRLYELTRYSFRVEQRGELAGLRRLRAFTMPDCHTFCKDLTQAKEEMLKRFDLALKIQSGFGLGRDELELGIRIVKDFYHENKDYVIKFVKKWGKPALLEMWDERFFYFVFKYELNFVDALEKAAALTTDQIDVENAERYKITYMDSDNKKKYPLILHLSPSGSIERVMYALLEKAYMEQKAGKNPILPLWLCPVQVRLCPVSENFLKFSENVMKEIESNNIRVDIDDRAESVQRKIRDAEVEWIPYIVVIGEKEEKTGKLAVRFRKTGEVKKMDINEIVEMIKKETKEKPFKPLSIPKYLTKRPVFIG